MIALIVYTRDAMPSSDNTAAIAQRDGRKTTAALRRRDAEEISGSVGLTPSENMGSLSLDVGMSSGSVSLHVEVAAPNSTFPSFPQFPAASIYYQSANSASATLSNHFEVASQEATTTSGTTLSPQQHPSESRV